MRSSAGYDVFFEKHAQGAGVLLHGVEKGQRHGSAPQHACVGHGESRKMEHDVARHGSAPVHHFDALPHIGRIGVMDACGRSGLHAHAESACHKASCGLGGEGEAAFGVVFACRQADGKRPFTGSHSQ